MAGEEQFSGVEPLFELSNVVVYAEEEEFGTGSITITEQLVHLVILPFYFK